MRSKLRSMLFFWVGGFLVVGGILYFKWKQFLNTPINQGSTPFTIQVRAGQSMRQVAWMLKSQKRLASPRFFMGLAYFKGGAHRIQAGDYLIPPGIKPGALLDKMISGEVILCRFTIVEGWTFRHLMKKMQENPNFSHALNALTPEQIMEKLGAKGVSPEGQFYPDTYLFHHGISEFEILKKAHRKMQKLIQTAFENKAAHLPYTTPQTGLIVASLIQKETGVEAEYSKVSAVIRNRLKKQMPLQIDPTVIYGLGAQYAYPLTQQQLTQDTPYNTYTRKGLPPTPIAMVNEKALHAAFHPEDSPALYFVADGKGGHTFSSHLEGHSNAVAQYRKAQQQKNLGKRFATNVCIWVLGFSAYAQ